MPTLRYPNIPSCFLTWCEPPDERGDERFRIVSWRRSLTLKGHSFREFNRSIIPLLDGKHTIDQICNAVNDVFDRTDLIMALDTLQAQGIVVDAADNAQETPSRLEPQVNYLHETTEQGNAAQQRISTSRVVVFGMGCAGATLARTLGAAGVGHLVLVDSQTVRDTDVYFSAVFTNEDVGQNRAKVVEKKLPQIASEVEVTAVTERANEAEDITPLIDGASLVVSCLESGDLNLALKLNRACHSLKLRCLTGALEGPDVVVGPAFPATDNAPCFMCYRMREVACAVNPESRFAHEKRLDQTKEDLSNRRENLASGADILAGMLATESLNVLAGVIEPMLDGRLIVVNLPTLQTEKHVVLRKPGCPVCGLKELSAS